MFPGAVETYENHAGYLTLLTRHFTEDAKVPAENWVRLPVSHGGAELNLASEDEWEQFFPWNALRQARPSRGAVAAERRELEVLLCLAAVSPLPGEVAEVVAAVAAWILPAEKRGA